MFRNIPVREARASIHVQPNQADIKGATQEDPSNCAYARCLKRTLEAPNVFVFKSIAYVQTLDEKGNPIMERYNVRKYARDYIVKFDSGEKIEAGGFVFHKPPNSKTLKYKQEHYKYQSPHTGPAPKKTKMIAFPMRSGKGKVHLFGKEDQIKAKM